MSDQEMKANSQKKNEESEVEEEEEFEDDDEEEYDSQEAIYEHNEYLGDNLPGLLLAMKVCIKETNVKCINVGDLSLATSHMRRIFNLLPNTQVTEFNTEQNDLRWGMPEFVQQLKKSNVRKLNLAHCELLTTDVLSLMEALKNTQVTDLDLSCLSSGESFRSKSAMSFIQHLIKSRLTHLKLTANSFLGYELSKPLASHLPHTSITHLWLEQIHLGDYYGAALKELFTNLPKTQVTELYLGGNGIVDDQLEPLCLNLKLSKLKKLGLHFNKLTDTGMNLLSKALIGSKLNELVVGMNDISGNNNLGKILKDTSITMMHLGWNKITNLEMFSFPNFLKDSSVTELYFDLCDLGDEVGQNLVKCLKSSEVTKIILSRNQLGLQTAVEFAKIIKETKITEVDFSANNFAVEAMEVLAEGIKGSKLKRFMLGGGSFKLQDCSPVIGFLNKIKDSTLESLDISNTDFGKESALLAASLENTRLTHLDLSNCRIGAGLADLAPVLKHTAITHLNLSGNKVNDVGVQKLAEFLKETNIFQLKLKNNCISDTGAKALMLCLKSGPLYHLNLERNKISEAGVEKLAEMLEGTFITNLDVSYNEENRNLPAVTVMWRNRLLVHRLVSFFNTIIPTDSHTFNFNSNLNDSEFNVFVEKGLLFYKAVVEEPSAISALTNNESVHFSRDQVKELVLEAFPNQFSSFIGSNTKLEVEQHVKFLERAKELGVSKIVEFFMSNIGALVIENSQKILRTSAYKLLKKHEAAICSLKLEPESKEKLIQYFAQPPKTN